MKKLILGVSLLLITLGAQAEVVAKYRFGVRVPIANDNGLHGRGEGRVYNVSLHDDGHLTVNVKKGFRDFFGTETEEVTEDSYEKVLSPVVSRLLLDDVRGLSSAKINHTEFRLVCSIMPDFVLFNNHLEVARDFDHTTGEYRGDIALVDGPSGCWLANQTHPESAYNRAQAASLKRSLKVLAIEE